MKRPNSPGNRSVVMLILTLVLLILAMENSNAQEQSTYMRIARITVDKAKLDAYKLALNEQMQSALDHEKGVLAYSAVQEKNDPSRITILETYASVAAYQSHIMTAHFKKYKAAVEGMVTQLELIDVVPIGVRAKSGK